MLLAVSPKNNCFQNYGVIITIHNLRKREKETGKMTSYEDIKNNKKLLLAMTGLLPSEFKIFLVTFKNVWNEQESAHIESSERVRGYGGGRKSSLDNIENKLLFILFYFKTYPLQIVIGHFFGMGQSQANEWIYKLSGVLKTALDEVGHLPERNPEKLERLLEEDGTSEAAIDGTERRIQRPKDKEKQRQFYSGKKKGHTVKNDVIVGVKDRKVKYLSQTCEGKKHDKKICDEENPGYPPEITLYKDKGFQGYEPEGVKTKQVKKKPRGGELSVDEQIENAIISGIRIVAEHVISGVKRCRIVKDVFRNTKEGFDDLIMEIACGLHNFRTECR